MLQLKINTLKNGGKTYNLNAKEWYNKEIEEIAIDSKNLIIISNPQNMSKEKWEAIATWKATTLVTGFSNYLKLIDQALQPQATIQRNNSL